MSNRQLGNFAIQEIRASMTGKRGAAAASEAERLSALFEVSTGRIYELTKDVRRAERKTRSDKGRRAFELIEGSDLWVAAQLVIVDKLDPDQALLVCEKRGLENLPSLEYFQRILRENGLGKKQRTMTRRPFRQWEAEFPGEIMQIDVTALKVRWEDEKTRRILRIEGVDKNHPQTDESKLRVWQIMATDDHSRRRFLRYLSTAHITSRDIVEFCCELFDLWGVPRSLYVDNGAEFKGYFVRAEKILNKILETEGGFAINRHAPGNSQASGKVENAHKWAEKMDRYVGLAVTEGQPVTIENLNPFADAICEFYNNRLHRTTGQTPNARWFGKRIVVRRLPREIIESALLADEFETRLDAALTVAHKGAVYKVPGVQPFVNYVGQKVKIVVPLNIDLILLTLPDGSEWEIEKILATADKAGEFKSHAESKPENLKKRLRESRRAEVKTLKEKSRQTGEIAPVPFFNVPIEQPATNVAHFPHQERIVSAEEIAAVAPLPSSFYAGKELSYWEAVSRFGDQFDSVEEAKEFFKQLFGDGEVINESEIESAIENRRQSQPARHLRAV
jgi:hypothetical protein